MNKRLIAALLSGLVCPGAGQLYKREYVKGGVLVAASIVILSMFAYKTWTALLVLAQATPPEELMSNALALAGKIIDSNKVFFERAGVAFIAVWAYAVLDTLLCRKKNTT